MIVFILAECEHDTVELDCDSFGLTRVIEVEDVFYGRDDTNTCSNGTPIDLDVSCYAGKYLIITDQFMSYNKNTGENCQ